MTPLLGMSAAAVGAAAVAVAAGAPAREIGLGLAGPLVAGLASWAAMARTARAAPGRMTAVMLQAFAVKAVFFGVYVAVVLRGLRPDATSFVVSFAGFFIGIYVMEALYLQRLMSGTRYPRDAD